MTIRLQIQIAAGLLCQFTARLETRKPNRGCFVYGGERDPYHTRGFSSFHNHKCLYMGTRADPLLLQCECSHRPQSEIRVLYITLSQTILQVGFPSQKVWPSLVTWLALPFFDCGNFGCLSLQVPID